VIGQGDSQRVLLPSPRRPATRARRGDSPANADGSDWDFPLFWLFAIAGAIVVGGALAAIRLIWLP
jgi:hypothetical protein